MGVCSIRNITHEGRLRVCAINDAASDYSESRVLTVNLVPTNTKKCVVHVRQNVLRWARFAIWHSFAKQARNSHHHTAVGMKMAIATLQSRKSQLSPFFSEWMSPTSAQGWREPYELTPCVFHSQQILVHSGTGEQAISIYSRTRLHRTCLHWTILPIELFLDMVHLQWEYIAKSTLTLNKNTIDNRYIEREMLQKCPPRLAFPHDGGKFCRHTLQSGRAQLLMATSLALIRKCERLRPQLLQPFRQCGEVYTVSGSNVVQADRIILCGSKAVSSMKCFYKWYVLLWRPNP